SRGTIGKYMAEQALQEHEELKRVTGLFENLLGQVLHDRILMRAKLIQTGWRFVEINLGHIKKEEETTFIWARELLTEVDWAIIASHPLTRKRGEAVASSIQHECAQFLQRSPTQPSF